MTSTSSEDAFGAAFDYKINYFTFSQQKLLNSEFLNIPLFSKSSVFVTNKHFTDDFSVFFQYELYFLVPISTQKPTSASSEDAFGTAFHYKTNYSTFSQQTLLNPEFLNIPLFPKNLFLATISIIQSILVYFSSMNVGL